MSEARYVVTGTDTGVGKTVFAAGLTRLLDGLYWKPVQAGMDTETDTCAVQRLANISSDRTIREAWKLTTPASPHLAAERDGLTLDPYSLTLPDTGPRPLIIEGAGGLMVPWSREILFIDLIRRWRVPVILCARTALGTLNHTMLSLEALRRRGIGVLGLALIGEAHPDNERTLNEMTGVRMLGRLPHLSPLTPTTLHAAFAKAFRRDSFMRSSSP